MIHIISVILSTCANWKAYKHIGMVICHCVFGGRRMLMAVKIMCTNKKPQTLFRCVLDKTVISVNFMQLSKMFD